MGENKTEDQPEKAFNNLISEPKPEKKMVFDHHSQELGIKTAEELESSDVVVDQIYKDGFFVGEPH